MKESNKTLIAIVIVIAVIAIISRLSSGPASVVMPEPEGPALSAAASLANSVYINTNMAKGKFRGTVGDNSIVAQVSNMSELNTIKMSYSQEFAISRHCFDTLVALDAENNIVPAAAESWEASGDGMKWTFRLRPDAKWVDSAGREVRGVRASDFVFAVRELLTPSNGAEYWDFASIFKNARAYHAGNAAWSEVGIRAAGEHTLELELEEPLPILLQYMRFEVLSPICEEFYTRVGASAYGTAPDKMVYNGPFRITEWEHERSIVMEKNELWRDAASVGLDKITFVRYTDSDERDRDFRAGKLDIADVTGDQRRAYEAEGFTVQSYVGGYSAYYLCNVLTEEQMAARPNAKLSALRNKNLRHAISCAINRDALIEQIYKNDTQAAGSLVHGVSGKGSETFAGAVAADNDGAPRFPPNADRNLAHEYLRAALNDLGLSDPSELDITIMTTEGTETEAFSLAVQEHLDLLLGLQVKIEVLPAAECHRRFNDINYDIYLDGWRPDYDDPLSTLELMTTDNGNNHGGYSNPEYDELIASAERESDAAKREELFVKAERIIAEDLPVIPIYWRHEDYVESEKIRSGVIRCPFQEYYLAYTQLVQKKK